MPPKLVSSFGSKHFIFVRKEFARFREGFLSAEWWRLICKTTRFAEQPVRRGGGAGGEVWYLFRIKDKNKNS